MKSFNQHTEHELDREQLDEEVNKKVKIDEATAGDFLMGLGAAGGLLALKKGSVLAVELVSLERISYNFKWKLLSDYSMDFGS